MKVPVFIDLGVDLSNEIDQKYFLHFENCFVYVNMTSAGDKIIAFVIMMYILLL